MLNTFLFGIKGRMDPVMNAAAVDPTIIDYRNGLFDTVLAENTLQAIISFGNGADLAITNWPGRPAARSVRVTSPIFPARISRSASLTGTAMVRRSAAWVFVLLAAVSWHVGCAPPAAPGVSTFDWSVTPAALPLQPGSAGTFAIRIDSKVNINSAVAFSLAGNVPPGSTSAFNPVQLPGTGRDATLTVQTSRRRPRARTR